MTRWIAAAVVVLVLVLAGEARAASFVEGNDLHEWCENEGAGNQSACAAYVMGIADVITFIKIEGDFKSRACFSKQMTSVQLADVVKRWLEQYPEYRHYSAAGLVGSALAEAFPCE